MGKGDATLMRMKRRAIFRIGWRCLAMGLLAALGAQARPVFVVQGAKQALLLQKSGALNDNSVVIHGDDMWRLLGPGAAGAAPPSPRGRRRPPGRSNRQQPIHVCLKPIVEGATDLEDLRRRFVSEVTL